MENKVLKREIKFIETKRSKIINNGDLKEWMILGNILNILHLVKEHKDDIEMLHLTLNAIIKTFKWYKETKDEESK